MSARKTLGQRTEMRFAGKTMPLRYYALPALGIAVWITVAFTIGFAWDPLSLTIGGIVAGLLVFSSVLSRLRNWAVLRRDHVAISVWLLMPVGSRRIPYDKIERLQTDDLTGEVSIWYKNDLGEVDIIGLFLKIPSVASTLRDEIILRQPRATCYGAEDTPVDSQRATPQADLLPEGLREAPVPGRNLDLDDMGVHLGLTIVSARHHTGHGHTFFAAGMVDLEWVPRRPHGAFSHTRQDPDLPGYSFAPG